MWLLLQSVSPIAPGGPTDTVWYAIFIAMAGAISAVFGLAVWLVRDRITICESRVTKFLEEDTKKIDVIREATSVSSRAVAITEKIFESVTIVGQYSQSNREVLNAHTAILSELTKGVSSLQSALNDLARSRDSPRR